MQSRPSPFEIRAPRERGIALVIVLGFLVLLSVLLISFFSSVSNELVSAKSAAASVSTRQLSESTTSLVISQIADATAGYKDSANPSSGVLAWASQPGMIRTYGDDGEPYRYHKLYSSKNMVITDMPPGYNVNQEFAADVPANWNESKSRAAFVDLNEPVQATAVSPQGQTVIRYEYPIVDPSAQKSAPGRLDGVDGFEVMPAPGKAVASTRPSDGYDPIKSGNLAPMPARWLYVLKDGSMAPAPDPDGDGKLDFGKVDIAKLRPTKENPIVGRVAFWTDDDTAKVNVNTASEGVYWDRPWSMSGADGAETRFANYIPAQNEFQRYPGHPAMTCLSAVFGWAMPYQSAAQKGNYYSLIPRVMDGGTKAGTVKATDANPLVSDNERLFASVDELAFLPQFTGIRKSPIYMPTSPDGVHGGVRDMLEKTRFFLTATSRAPEVNLFNKPRIGLWPIQVNPSARNAKDKLIAFCGTTPGADPSRPAIYYFQRYNEYVLNGNKVFGDGRVFTKAGMPSSESPILDWSGVTRNQELYTYLQTLTGSPVPGFGGSLKDKLEKEFAASNGGPDTNERDQVLTEIMDYIRTQVNSYSTANNMSPQYDYAPTRRGGPVAGETQLVPLVLPNKTKGFGRFATVTEAALVFFRQTVPPSGSTPAKDYLRAALVLEIFNPTPGPASWSPHVRYVVQGLDGISPVTGAGNQFMVGGAAFGGSFQPMNWPQPRTANNRKVWPWNFVTSRVGYSGGGHKTAFMGTWASFRYFKDGGSDNTKVLGINGTESEYPFFTDPGVLIPSPATNRFDFRGGDMDIRIYSGFENCSFPGQPPSENNLVQVLHLNFPDITGLLLPTSSGNTTFADRLAGGAGSLINSTNDIVRSVEARADGATGGDLRMTCGLAEVPVEYFAPHYKYSDPNFRMAHSIRSEGFNWTGTNGSTTKPSAANVLITTSYNREPAAARGVAGAQNVSGIGDFDNATGDWEDGAYINKADEGNISTGNVYFDRGSFNVEAGESYSPNRQISSAVTFGSLPTGIKRTQAAARGAIQANAARPWQTLLFCPNPVSRVSPPAFGPDANKHPGFGTVKLTGNNPGGTRNQPPYLYPPDHMLLDLFTMPIVEPYAISEPFSTAGKVNLNYQIAPFTYIKRATGLHAVLRSTKMMAIPTSSTDKSQSRRYDINPDVGQGVDGSKLDGPAKGTLWGFWDKFSQGDIFRSASQICDISLVPTGQDANGVSYDNIDTFWRTRQRTGDNVRETPYGHIYPRVTTKSNSFTVHMRVQALGKATNSPPDQWDESRDQVLSEYRGSTSLERYIDAADPTLPDFAKGGTSDNLDRHYRFRVVATKAFNP